MDTDYGKSKDSGPMYKDDASHQKLDYSPSTTDSDTSTASDYSTHIVTMPNSRSNKNDRSMADIRVRIHLCQRAWTLLVRSKLSVPMGFMMKFPAVVLLVMGSVFLVYTYLITHTQFTLSPLDLLNTVSLSAPIRTNLPQNPNTRSKHNGTWQPLGPALGLEGFAYTAFYDDRVSLGSLPVVRVIIVAREFEKHNMYCILRYHEGNKVEYMPVKTSDIGAGIYREQKMFKEYIFACPLQHEHVPQTVGFVQKEGELPAFEMPIEIPMRPGSRENFGLCVSVTYWKHDPHQIVEWMEFLRLMGVSKVTIYNNSLEREAADIFKHYDLMGFVDFRQSHNFIHEHGELSIHMHMSPVINDCMYRNLFKYKKIIVTDLDELIVPRSTDNYHQMVEAIEKRETDKGNNIPSKHYLFRNNYFFLDIPDGEDRSQSPHLVTLRHRKKIPVSENGYSIKSIIDPLSCQNMHNHYCWVTTALYSRAMLEHVEVDTDIALNQHYKKCHLDVWDKPGMCRASMAQAVWDDNILRFKSSLMKAVKPQLELLGLDPL